MSSLSQQLARAREQAHKSQEEIAVELGWKGQGTLSGIERGYSRIHLQQLDRWAAVLGKRIVLVDLEEGDRPLLAAQVREHERAAISAMVKHYFAAVDDPLYEDVKILCCRIERGEHAHG